MDLKQLAKGRMTMINSSEKFNDAADGQRTPDPLKAEKMTTPLATGSAKKAISHLRHASFGGQTF